MDVALGAPLDLIQQNLHRLKGHLPLGLLHRSQVAARRIPRALESVEARMAV